MKYSIAALFFGCLYLCTLSDLQATLPDFVYTYCCYDKEISGAKLGTNYCPCGWGEFTKIGTCASQGGFIPE